MRKINGLLKALLVLLVVGIWSLLLINVSSGYLSYAQARKQYGVWAAGEGGMAINGSGGTALTADGLATALSETPRQGWRVHTVLYNSQIGGYVVVVEK